MRSAIQKPEQSHVITASMLYNHLVCPHRVAMDAFGDWSRRDKVSPFVHMLWDRGNKYEAQVIENLGLEFEDLSALTGDEKEAVTRAAIAEGRPLIYKGRLSEDGLLGEPDLLTRLGAAAGRHGYIWDVPSAMRCARSSRPSETSQGHGCPRMSTAIRRSFGESVRIPCASCRHAPR